MTERTKEIKYSDNVIKSLAKEYGIPEQVVRQIVHAPFRFATRVIRDSTDHRPIRIRGLGSFVTKKRYLKAISSIDAMYKVLMDNIDYVYLLCNSVLGFQLVDVESAKRMLKAALDSNDTEKMRMIFKEFMLHASPPSS